MKLMKGTTRRNALNKLAALSAQTTASQDAGGGEDIERLCSLSHRHTTKTEANGSINGVGSAVHTSSVPMSVRELEVLVALCRAAPLLQTTKDADDLLHQLAPYVPEAHRQALGPSSLHQHLPPWETLAFDLTSAILAIGLNHPSLRTQAVVCIDDTIEELTRSSENRGGASSGEDDVSQRHTAEQSFAAIQLTVSLLGFLKATAKYVQVWTPEQRMSVIQKLRYLLSEKFMVSIEGALSAVRNTRSHSGPVKEWKRWVRHYASRGTPLGALLLQQAYMSVVEESVVLLLSGPEPLSSSELLDTLMQRRPLVDNASLHYGDDMLGELTELIIEEINLLEADADYLQVSSAWQQRLALEVKASCLRSYLCCSLINEGIADDELLMSWLDAITSDSVQMADESLAQTVLKSMAILSRTSSATATNLSHSMPRLLVQGKMPPQTAKVAGECLARILQQLSQDMVISTLYSLGNVLSAGAGNDTSSPFFDSIGGVNGSAHPYGSEQALGSQISFMMTDEEETTAVYGSVVQAIVSVATACNDDQITALVISMLVQKMGRVSAAVDARIVTETAALGVSGGPNQLKALVRLYARIASDALVKRDDLLMHAVTEARVRLATWIKKNSPLYETYLVHLLDLCVSSGDTAGERTVDIALATETIAQLFRPLAVLASEATEHTPVFENKDELMELSRDAWFNIIVHGFMFNSKGTREHAEVLEVLAQHSLPLVDEDRVDMPESGIDLNTVLRRGSSGQRTVEMKTTLLSALPQCEHDIKSLSYPDCVFLNAALLICTTRARAGDCTTVLPYFLENKVKKTVMGNIMFGIAQMSVDTYLERALSGQRQDFAAPQVASQLVAFFEGACHRISKVQHAAVSSADRIISQIPSALSQKASLFALLELLSLMWKSCLDAETDEYEWKAIYKSDRGGVSIQVSDDVSYRQYTLTNFHKRCRLWVSKAIDVAPLDVKGLLQAYLEDYEDDGAYGHIALGRSFAVEMGSMIPNTDHRLTSLDREHDVGVNTASDFIAQYTTRQEYRHSDRHSKPDEEWALVDYNGKSQIAGPIDRAVEHLDEAVKLRALAKRLHDHQPISFPEVRETLRGAAGIVSRCASDGTPLIADLVGIPFAIFTKQSINLGISLWLGVVKENPSLESRILVEIASGWESSVRLKKGFFNSTFRHLDPFYVKEEFAPSKWGAISRRQQLTNNLIGPHLRLTHLLASHFSASRLISPSVEHVYGRLMRITMLAMKDTISQPLAREVHFQIVLLALRVLRYSTHMDAVARWRLKDAILSGGLAWFAMPPCWSFGSNRLQLKAEVKILNDVAAMLREVNSVAAKSTGSLPSLQTKHELLYELLLHEMGRISVWISPLGNDSMSMPSAAGQGGTVRDSVFLPLLHAAWAVDPRLAVQLGVRFSNSNQLTSEVRGYLLRQPEKVIDEPDALYLLLGSSLPSDVKEQLKYLLYWAPINPMAAVTYFLPSYGNHPFVIQYAVRALESHSVDVTFFYVPQIVQTLRYDALGYVERYIIETAQFSQLFAHQIIWNMKANAFKDEESTQPDPVKPVLDKVTDAMVSSWSSEDRSFYEREFDFFGKVTGISGTLKPLIPRPKPEKKRKIEEELRKIQVEVGVYLPSNPDGVVIGIDRKSGKPLQSHAKAPFMATFRIRKDETQPEQIENQATQNGEVQKRKTYEVWQSAIFKVGDDCRQDVLALQMISAFRGIFNSVGLDVYVFPYRVTATAPGCGVIDVLPNSISRDMLGREAVNGLYEYFISKYGYEDSIRFQEARNNFIKSMAAYSIISFLLQFKDRHNGNIMVDEAGHILHIDFGFCFDIAPGGIKFERAPFKLTPEMVAVMGGSTDSQPFRAFEELCVKAFLASRQHVEQLSHIVLTMLDSGLPCFKPQTMKHFRERFVLEKSDREAADFARHLVHVSERSYSTGVYDYFQLLTNGIPY
ncbi:Phosphatidylinositol 4-kinase stt4 [Vermiconidia calcicola]|uniref:Phosphatidylinositol 4-kinase stt4 n=1 Tax=Vermiconidia calcicola TaxID=1690605 RepID=A0ACC3NFB2_9PEZI|nr:Phosphatidylinositol 4-kinase stt4 [Vermiconidia calcicola]